MAWKEYPYLGFWENSDVTYRPYIPITLHNGVNMFTVDALVDSGADFLVANTDIARALEINLDLCPRRGLSGSTGSKDCYACDLTYEVEGFPKVVIETQVFFLDDLPVPCLVGQGDFFSRFLVQFDKSTNSFKVRRK